MQQGNWRALRQALEALVYDGATNLSAFNVPVNADLALVFTDGLDNYGTGPTKSLQVSEIPIFAINSAAAANPTLLKQIAQRKGGSYLDLQSLSVAEALRELSLQRTRLRELRGQGLGDLISASSVPE